MVTSRSRPSLSFIERLFDTESDIAFVDEDQFPEIFDTKFGRSEDMLVLLGGIDDMEAAILRLHADANVMQEIFILAELSGDAGGSIDKMDCRHDQAACF
ncbi:hypothetical protein [Gluconacetobacter asukensis]|uniref:Uncharacterized protein n=1 Tax=Gluconacetobacter asukensis TaxID=1017181 RepID=A0A7W4NZC0_9PROT|nr:hypothetical protein [Gluconacetobacter asukensis]MBB2171717.1 hypothetical protein [Gluconacetobacter asukensis]